MTSQDKKYPAFKDDDIMPFGIHKGKLIKQVPASYLAWLYNNMDRTSKKTKHEMIRNYIYNNITAINMELPPDKEILR